MGAVAQGGESPIDCQDGRLIQGERHALLKRVHELEAQVKHASKTGGSEPSDARGGHGGPTDPRSVSGMTARDGRVSRDGGVKGSGSTASGRRAEIRDSIVPPGTVALGQLIQWSKP